MAKTMKATVIATGEVVTVYRLNKGGYCNYADCATNYREDELKFH